MGRSLMEKAISLPFSINPFGSVSFSTDQRKIWADKVRSVVGTTIGERVMRPEFGGEIAFSVFDNQEAAIEAIKQNVTEMFNLQLPLLTLQNVDTSFDESTGTINADITYSLPNDEIIVTTTVGLIYLNGNTPAVKENL